MSDWKKWLTKFPWYSDDYGILYPKIVEELLHPRQARKDFFLKVITPDVPASKGYEALAELMHLGLIDTVLYNNFDNCLHNATIQVRRPPRIKLNKNAIGPRFSIFLYPAIPPTCISTWFCGTLHRSKS